jgi:methyl-accepting chemotaxis protein
MKVRFRAGAAMGRMRVAHQLRAAFTLIIVLTAMVGGVALFELSRVHAQAEALAGKWLVGAGQLSDVRAAFVEAREFEVKHSRSADRSYQSEYQEKIDHAAKLAGDGMTSYETLITDDAERALYVKLSKGWAAYRQAEQRVVGLGRDKKQQDAADISDGVASMAFDETLGALDALTAYVYAGGKAAAELAGTIYAQARNLILGLLAVCVLLGAALAEVITRKLLLQLGGEPSAATDVAEAVADGDLTTRIHVKHGDSRSLMARLAAMQQGLTIAVSNVRRGSENVAAASAQIAHGNQDLSDRTERQASALQQTAATMDALGSTVRKNAENALQANQLAREASAVAVQGGAVVGQVVDTMQGINDSSKRIADIIAVIEGIAFQTNILALNAAVEAARAGEQGRGFAVVASEVRSLAQRSSAAAKEIKELITASVERVGQGSTLVDRAGQTMDQIVGAIKRVTDVVGEISSASIEQSSGIAQIAQAVSQMDQATQQNAALVEQSAAAADTMKEQAHQLVETVALFRLAHDR